MDGYLISHRNLTILLFSSLSPRSRPLYPPRLSGNVCTARTSAFAGRCAFRSRCLFAASLCVVMKCERGVFSGDGELTRPRAAHTISETAEGALPKASYVPQARGNCCYCCHHGQRVVAQLRRQRELLHCTASPLMRAAAASRWRRSRCGRRRGLARR